MKRVARRALRDNRGAVGVYVTVLLPVLIGGALLSVDGARLSSLNSFMQAGADAFALAGAAELDGQSQPTGDDSITRAKNAINNMMANRNKMALGDSGSASITPATITFLSALPNKDQLAPTSITTDPKAARYVQVNVTAANFTTMFPATFVGALTNTAATGAVATAGGPLAGAGRQICLGPVVPMFICNPYEGSASSIFEATNPTDVNYALNHRRQILLQAGSATFAPGNFGWLDTPELGNGATALRDALSAIEPVAGGDCRVQRSTISQKTGNVANADDAMNTRFDLWSGPFNNGYKNATYVPAANVRKGAKPGNGAKGACSPATAAPNANSLPRDGTFTGRLGNGVYDLSAYWTTNFGGAFPSGLSATTSSRYDLYQYENANAKAGLAAIGGPAVGEKGSPQCYSGGSSATYDRRVLYVAVVNCSNLGINGNSGDLGAPVGYGKFFLTEPVSGGDYYSELIGLVGTGETVGDGGGGGPVSAVQENVQLYR